MAPVGIGVDDFGFLVYRRPQRHRGDIRLFADEGVEAVGVSLPG